MPKCSTGRHARLRGSAAEEEAVSAHRLAAAGLLTVALLFNVSHVPAASSPSSGVEVATPVIGSQTSDPSLLTLERIYSATEFGTQRFGPARWLADGSGYTTVEASDTFRGGDDIVRYEPETGEREVLVSAGRLFLPPQDNLPPGAPQRRQAFLTPTRSGSGGRTPEVIIGCSTSRTVARNSSAVAWSRRPSCSPSSRPTPRASPL